MKKRGPKIKLNSQKRIIILELLDNYGTPITQKYFVDKYGWPTYHDKNNNVSCATVRHHISNYRKSGIPILDEPVLTSKGTYVQGYKLSFNSIDNFKYRVKKGRPINTDNE